MTGPAPFCLALPSLHLAGHAASLLRDGVAGVVEHFLDLRQRHLLRIVVDVDGFGRDINADVAHAFQLSDRSLDHVLAMLTRNVWNHKGRRFHDRVVDSMIYSPLIQVKHLESNLYNSSLQCCSRSELHSEKVKGSIALPSGKMKEISLRISSNRVELDQLLNDFLFTIPFYPLRDTAA